MKTNNSYLSRMAYALCALCIIFPIPTQADDYEIEAKRILDVAGVKGGLVVHIGCGNGKLTAALRANEGFLVHGLDTQTENVHKAREFIQSIGTYGSVAIDTFDGECLPYADNIVNLVVAEHPGDVQMSEVMRVLCPNGVAYIKKDGTWNKTIKPWSEDIDEWTHYLYDTSGNAVSKDRVVGPPQHFQWISEPRFSRSHDHLASVSAMVSSEGRLFSIIDKGSIAYAAASPRWRLVAQDAFNGVKLWEREISSWEYHLRDFRSGPANIARRLVAVEDRVFVTLGYGLPVVALDAATGETIRTYTGTEGTQEILYDNGTLLLVLGDPQKDWQAQKAKQIVSQTGYRPPFEKYTPPAHKMRLMAIDTGIGELKWKNTESYTRELMPSTLAASGGRVYFQNADAVVCLDATSGQPRWETTRRVHRTRLAWSTPTLVVYDGIVYSADRSAAQTDGEILWIPSGGYHDYIRGEDVKGELIAYNAESGERLWSCPAYEGFNAPVDVMITDGLLWTGHYAWGNDPGIIEARDPKTGEVRRQRPSDLEFLPRIGHARCHRAKATTNYLILGRRGVEFLNLITGDMVANFWIRGICQYGVMPANGLLYIPPHSCACSVNDLLKCGFMSLAPKRKMENEKRKMTDEIRLVKGSAYDSIVNPKSKISDLKSKDWPTYRHDANRSSVTSIVVSHNLQVAWETDLGGKPTSPVIADDILLTAQTDAHSVHALDVASGREQWTFVAGARIDSPPTIDRGRALFGSADGWVYCLRLTDGELVWKFRAAPQKHYITVNGQLESSWPVSGNILVVDGAAFFTAGRTSYLDGGMFLYKLDAATGRILKRQHLNVEQKRRDGGFASGGYLPDILSSDGDSIYLRSARFDLDLVRLKDNVPHLWSSVGFLDDDWWHRTYWQFGTSMSSGWGGWAKAGQKVPAGRLLVIDPPRVFGFGRNQYDTPGSHVGIDADGVWGPIGRQQGRWTFYRLFRQTINTQSDTDSRRGLERNAVNKSDWTQEIPMVVQAMVLADKTLFIAGPSVKVNEIPRQPSDADPFAEALEAGRSGRLLAVSSDNGETLAGYDLKYSPVFDGMASANGRLYLSGVDGRIVCMNPRQ